MAYELAALARRYDALELLVRHGDIDSHQPFTELAADLELGLPHMPDGNDKLTAIELQGSSLVRAGLVAEGHGEPDMADAYFAMAKECLASAAAQGSWTVRGVQSMMLAAQGQTDEALRMWRSFSSLLQQAPGHIEARYLETAAEARAYIASAAAENQLG